MNFLMGSLLFHCSEDAAFWLFDALMRNPQFAMREIYLSGLPGLYSHCEKLESLLAKNLKELHVHFRKHGISLEMFCADWVFSLFSNSAPLSHMSLIYDEFFSDGWIFFYRFALSLLSRLQEKLLS